VYLDDIQIFSRNLEEHVTHIRSVLRRLLDNSLDPAKVSAVTSWPAAPFSLAA
jgi:hypothetical protein